MRPPTSRGIGLLIEDDVKDHAEHDAENRDKLVQLMHDIRNKTTDPGGRRNYLLQLETLGHYCAHEVCSLCMRWPE